MAVVERAPFGDDVAQMLRNALLVPLVAAALPCQVVPSPQERRTEPELHPLAPRVLEPPEVGFQPLETVEPRFQGFPTFPPSLGGYGGYPQVPDRLLNPPELGAGRAPPPLRPETPDWPSWVRVEGREPLPYAPDTAVVMRDAERVWYRTGREEPFVPLAFYDKVRPLSEGGQVQVRGVGEFQVLFHGGSRIRSYGRSDLLVGEMSEDKLELYVSDFSHMLVQSRARPAWIHLPDGNVVVTDVTDRRGAELDLEREGNRGWLVNHGPNPVLVRTPYGEVTLEPAHRVLVFLAAPGVVHSGELRHDGGVSIQREGHRVLATAGAGGGVVEWCGARVRVSEGASLELDALQGKVFPAGGGND